MFGEAQLTTAKKSGVLTVPQAALQSDAGRSFVYAIEDGKLARKPVTIGVRGDDGEGSAAEIIQGLESGAQIVKANLGVLRIGTPVKITQIASANASSQ